MPGVRAQAEHGLPFGTSRGTRYIDSPRALIQGALALVILGVSSFVAGCGTRPAWNDDPEAATLAYWSDRPAFVRVENDDYRALWNAADNARRRFGFVPALRDYRGGLLTTEPLVSAQPFEPWRQELRTAGAGLESALATVRRRIEFDFGRHDSGGFYVEPKVLVERLSLAERRITNAIDYRRVLGPGEQRGSTESDAGEDLPRSYWYAIGRDPALERTLANRIAARTNGRIVQPIPVKAEGGGQEAG